MNFKTLQDAIEAFLMTVPDASHPMVAEEIINIIKKHLGKK